MNQAVGELSLGLGLETRNWYSRICTRRQYGVHTLTGILLQYGSTRTSSNCTEYYEVVTSTTRTASNRMSYFGEIMLHQQSQQSNIIDHLCFTLRHSRSKDDIEILPRSSTRTG